MKRHRVKFLNINQNVDLSYSKKGGGPNFPIDLQI